MDGVAGIAPRRAAAQHIGSVVLALCVLLPASALAEGVSVRAAVEKSEVYVGESFVFQIQVEGSDSPQQPDLSALSDFSVEFAGGQQNNSQSIQIINGRMTRNVQQGYVFNYRLTARRAGRLTIPKVTVWVEGRQYATNPVSVSVSKPEESEHLKLRLSLSKDRCYVGEPIVLTVTWYIQTKVAGVSFAMPILEDERFQVEDPGLAQDPKRQYFQVPVGARQVILESGQGSLDGQQYTTYAFTQILIPKQPGEFVFPEATVACQGVVGRKRSRSLFDDPFFGDDLFSIGRREVYQNFVTPSNRLRLTVVDVPAEGRPDSFSGLVGSYRIETSAKPLEGNVGDPITLTVRISGSAYLKHVELPPLDKEPGMRERFKIPNEMAAAKLEGNVKTFTQTIRALDSDVTQIPPIELAFFDVGRGAYRVARSKPIPLKVHATKVVTAEDAEGAEAAVAQSRLTLWQKGIAYNYEDPSVLTHQAYGPDVWLRSPLLMALAGAPPLVYAGLLIGTVFWRRRHAHPELRKVRRAYGELAACLGAARKQSGPDAYGAILEALRAYLGAKLQTSAGALTFGDARARLAGMGVSEETLAGLKTVFDTCDAYRYAGGAGAAEGEVVLADQAERLAKRIEKELAQ